MALPTNKRKNVRRKKRNLSKEEKIIQRRDRKFRTDINTVFTNAGFTHVPTREVQLIIAGRQGDIDSFFVFENIFVLVEDTTAKNDIKDHIAKSADFFANIDANTKQTIQILSSKFPKFRSIKARGSYNDDEYRWVFVYCSLHPFDRKYEPRYSNVAFLRYSHLQYFLALSKTIGRSVRFELLKFLQLEITQIGSQQQGSDKREYTALILPESPSGFPPGHKVVSFLIEPETLIEQAYVLRRDGWRDNDCLYQRLLVKGKIGKMREYLASERRVFVNNIIATLPEDTQFFDETGRQVQPNRLSTMTTIKVELRRRLGSIGLIDGQHRVFAYHEGMDSLDRDIGTLRKKQHLLVTGIVYPSGTDQLTRTQFEAKLFLEINDKQTRTRGDLKQAIQTIVEPFSDIAIAKKVITLLAESGPLCGYLEEHFYDRQKIKTTSIVSYGMRHIVAIGSSDSLFTIWSHPEKSKLERSRNKPLLDEYVEFCSTHLRSFISGFQHNLSSDLWDTDKKKSRALTTTTINGLIFCLRELVRNGKTSNTQFYQSSFSKSTMDFRPQGFTFKSSHWRELGRKLYDQCFL
jgi:DGQHR domain-containing protein